MTRTCRTCARWEKGDEWSAGIVDPRNERICTEPKRMGSPIRIAVEYPESGPYLVTPPDFSCSLYEERKPL